MAWAGEFGAGVTATILSLIMLAASIWIGMKISDRVLPKNSSDEKGCLVGLLFAALAFGVLTLVFAPAIHVLKSYSCRSAGDYEMCMDPPASDPM
ncbi:hypothetical protein [Novosphingobium sp. RL4]|uniref:hypothetical protein n=1 Tax=Novosphingobium sp. RL4 TaxID=3109595 RepID=UPI002D76C09A|nr:hypothetical protein [Novosphingobium sp. RL4]WRT91346.1 hypothetical protein U9J33_08885 [Novosphingobium sp. RL4]